MVKNPPWPTLEPGLESVWSREGEKCPSEVTSSSQVVNPLLSDNHLLSLLKEKELSSSIESFLLFLHATSFVSLHPYSFLILMKKLYEGNIPQDLRLPTWQERSHCTTSAWAEIQRCQLLTSKESGRATSKSGKPKHLKEVRTFLGIPYHSTARYSFFNFPQSIQGLGTLEQQINLLSGKKLTGWL